MSRDFVDGEASILLVSIKEDMKDCIKGIAAQDHSLYSTNSIDHAIEVLATFDIGLVIIDVEMTDERGIEFIQFIRESYPDVLSIALSTNGSTTEAVEVMRSGAFDYISNPDTAACEHSLGRALQKMQNIRAAATAAVNNVDSFCGMIGRSKAMKEIFAKIERAAATSVTILISGESGTGKELTARAIHTLSRETRKSFIPVNCGAVPETLLESELFGHVKGSFTNATETRNGYFQMANRGTIFLDEISNMSLAMQAKLLRVLQDKVVQKVGAAVFENIDVRIILATNHDLKVLIDQGKFREDLYYRINVFPIHIPPLRERTEDIPLLAGSLLVRICAEHQKPMMQLSDSVMEKFLGYSWPGNVREMENLLHQLVLMSTSNVIDINDLPQQMRLAFSQKEVMKSLEKKEMEYVLQVLEYTKGNKSRAAEILGIDRKTLHKKMKKTTPLND